MNDDNDAGFTCPDCNATEKELEKEGHKPNCPNPGKAKLLLKSLFGNCIPITDD